MFTNRTSTLLAAFIGGCLLLFSWAACSVAAGFPAKGFGESIRAAVHSAMEQGKPCQQKPEPALDSKAGNPGKPEETPKLNTDGAAVERPAPGIRPSPPRIALCDPPYLQINLPSWCGSVPYPLPPPSSHPA